MGKHLNRGELPSWLADDVAASQPVGGILALAPTSDCDCDEDRIHGGMERLDQGKSQRN